MTITHDAGYNKILFLERRLAVRPQRDFTFIGRLSLDFAQTGDMGWGDRFERLTSPAELQRWLSLSPLQLANIRITADDLRDAKMLRRAIWRVAEATLANAVPRGTDIRLINRGDDRSVLVKELDLSAASMRWHHPTIHAALSTIAQDAVMLFGDPRQRARLRRCEHERCRVIFFDDSRPGLRRWCASNRCGDRTRARAYRERKKS
jgi:predicted RNA-binding Zn ribbon-like protein